MGWLALSRGYFPISLNFYREDSREYNNISKIIALPVLLGNLTWREIPAYRPSFSGRTCPPYYLPAERRRRSYR